MGNYIFSETPEENSTSIVHDETNNDNNLKLIFNQDKSIITRYIPKQTFLNHPYWCLSLMISDFESRNNIDEISMDNIISLEVLDNIIPWLNKNDYSNCDDSTINLLLEQGIIISTSYIKLKESINMLEHKNHWTSYRLSDLIKLELGPIYGTIICESLDEYKRWNVYIQQSSMRIIPFQKIFVSGVMIVFLNSVPIWISDFGDLASMSLGQRNMKINPYYHKTCTNVHLGHLSPLTISSNNILTCICECENICPHEIYDLYNISGRGVIGRDGEWGPRGNMFGYEYPKFIFEQIIDDQIKILEADKKIIKSLKDCPSRHYIMKNYCDHMNLHIYCGYIKI